MSDTDALPPLSPADAELFALAPITARRVLDVAAPDAVFARYYAVLNPAAEVAPTPSLTTAEDLHDLIVLRPGGTAGLGALLSAALARLAPGGAILAVLPKGRLDPLPAGLKIIRHRVPPPGAPGEWMSFLIRREAEAAPPLQVHFRFMAPRLMDIRTTLPAALLSRDPDLIVVTHQGQDGFWFDKVPADTPKILVTQRPGLTTEDKWLRSLAGAVRNGWISVVEYDDHPAATAQALGHDVTEYGLRHFGQHHAVQTSTARLADLFRTLNPEVATFQNAVFDLPPLPVRSGPPKVFYGAISRGPLAKDVARSMGPVAERHPDVEFVVVGDGEVFEALPVQNKRFFGYLPYAQYLQVMRVCDISLSPLEESEVAACKSDAKFLDAARNGLAFIGSPTVYADTVVDGQTGFIAHSAADWPRLVEHMIVEPAARTAAAASAYAYVREARMFAHQAARRRDWYRSLWDRRQALNQALLQRAPALRSYLP